MHSTSISAGLVNDAVENLNLSLESGPVRLNCCGVFVSIELQ